MGAITNGIITAANLLGSAQTIHSSTRYFMNQIQKKPIEFTFNAPKEVKVNEKAYFWGTAPPGVVFIYSEGAVFLDSSNVKKYEDFLEKRIFPEVNGHYGAILYFSKPGLYRMIAVYRDQKIERNVNAT